MLTGPPRATLARRAEPRFRERGAALLRPFGPDIWIADGPVTADAAGFRYPTRMSVMRLSGGDLVLWDPVQLSDALRREVEGLGNVRYLVAPNGLRHSSVGDWHRAYPVAQVHAPPGLREKRQDIRFAGDLGKVAVAGWSGELDVVVVRGNRLIGEAVGFHRPSGTAIFADLLQQVPSGWFTGWRGLVARLDLIVAGQPSVPRRYRLAFSDRRVARAALRRILAWRAGSVLMGCGEPVTERGDAFLRDAFSWLMER